MTSVTHLYTLFRDEEHTKDYAFEIEFYEEIVPEVRGLCNRVHPS